VPCGGSWKMALVTAPRPSTGAFGRKEISIYEVIAMKFRPLHDRVLVRRIDQDSRTPGGIIIPDTAKEKPQEGEVVAVGPGARGDDNELIPLDVKTGDRILFGKWSGTEVKINGEELLIIKESDILGVLEGATEAREAA